MKHRILTTRLSPTLTKAIRTTMTLVVAVLAVACSHEGGSTAISESDRQALDSTLRRVTQVDSARALLHTYEQQGNTWGQIAARRQLGKLLREDSRFLDAIDCHQAGLQMATEVQDTLEMIQALNSIGTNYRRMGSLEEAAAYHQQAVALSTDLNDKQSYAARKNRVVSLNGMGNVLMSLGNLEQADSILRLALQGEHQLGSALGQAINLANLGAIQEQTGHPDSARAFYEQSLLMNEQAGSTLGIALCRIHFGELSQAEGRLDEAIGEYATAYDLLGRTGDDWHWLEATLHIARAYIEKGMTAQALTYLSQADTTARRIGSQEHMVEVYRCYYDFYERTGQLRLALDNYIKSDRLQDSLLNLGKLSNIQNQRLERERMRSRQVVQLAEKNLELERSSKTTMLVLAIALLLLALAAIVLMGYHLHTRGVKQRMTQQVQHARELFFTNVTHEFRTPLTVILGLGHQLEDNDIEDMAQVRSAAKMIVRQGNSLLGLINQLLDISKVRSAVGEAKWRHGNIVAFVDMAVANFRPYAESKRQELTYTHSLTTLETDFVPGYVERIMANLLANAIKYTPAYGKVNVTLEQSGAGRVKIQVFDTGRGIKADVLPHIFDAFFQGETQPGDVGTGVGLSLVRLMADAMGGSVSAESIEGQGSTFTVVLPMKSRAATQPLTDDDATPAATGLSPMAADLIPTNAETSPTGTETSPTGTTDSTRPTVLIVEDNQDIAFYIGMHLKGWQLLYARGGAEGLQKARETMPDMIITDIMMPGETDGLELCRQIRQSELLSHIPVIIITAKTTEQDRIRGLEAGADAYLVKPFNSEELLVRVRKLTERQQRLREKYTQMAIDDEQQTPTELSAADRKFMNRLVDVVYRLMAQGSADVETLAAEMAVSRSQLNRKVLAITGQNTSAYVMRLRLARAKRLLKADITTPVGDVATRCGFDDVAYFSRIFKQTFQMTPTQYRKQQT